MTFREAFDQLYSAYPEEMGKFLQIYGIHDVDACAPELLCGPSALMLLHAQEKGECIPEFVSRPVITTASKVAAGEPVDGISDAALSMQLDDALQFI